MATSASFKPDLLYWEGRFRRDLAVAVTEDGLLAEPSSATAPLRLAGRALLPGLVNAHSHAFQRLLRGRTEHAALGKADDFWSWRERMYQAAEALGPEELYIASRQAFLEMALAGITTVGEFHYLHHAPDGSPYANRNELALAVIRAAREVGVRIALLRVGYARAGFGLSPNLRQRRFVDASLDAVLRAADELASSVSSDPMVSVGLAPHSVRAVPKSWLRDIAALRGRVVHMHVAEQPAEIEACQAEHGRRPVELLQELGLLREGFTAVHAIHLSPEEVVALGRAGATVCACPSTERNLGDGVVPADALAKAHVPVALGSDSQAHIDLLEEARQLELHLRLIRQRRAVLDPRDGRASALAERLFSYATARGAQSLGLAGGELRVGAPADFFTVDLGHPSLAGAQEDELLSAIVFGAEKGAVREVAVGGRLIVRDGRHAVEEKACREYASLSGRLRA